MAKFGIAPEWGSGGRWFKSSHSDQKSTCLKKAGAFFHRQSRTSGLLPLQSAARREIAAQRRSPRWFKSSHSDQKKHLLSKSRCFFHTQNRVNIPAAGKVSSCFPVVFISDIKDKRHSLSGECLLSFTSAGQRPAVPNEAADGKRNGPALPPK